MSLEQRLAELGLVLPDTAAPGARYAAVVEHAGLAWVSGQLPREGDRVVARGKPGRDLFVADAQAGARLALLRALAALRDEVGLARVERILKLTVYVNRARTSPSTARWPTARPRWSTRCSARRSAATRARAWAWRSCRATAAARSTSSRR